MDRAHRSTDKVVDNVEKQIAEVYKRHEDKLAGMYEKYFSQFADADEKKKKELDDELITKQQYVAWRSKTMMSGSKWKRFLKAVTKEIYKANVEAVAVTNKSLPNVFVENYNFIGKDVERQVNELGNI